MATVHPSRLGLISEDLRPQQDASKRRASPHYDDYKSRPPAAQRMYPERGASSRYGGGHFEGNPDWLDRSVPLAIPFTRRWELTTHIPAGENNEKLYK